MAATCSWRCLQERNDALAPIISARQASEHVDKLLAEVTPMLGDLSRLSARMNNRGMGTEPLAADVRRASDAMQALGMSLHYLNCSGLGERAIGR